MYQGCQNLMFHVVRCSDVLDSLKPYNLIFIQKASPVQGDAFDMAFVYKFFTERNEKTQRLKYIIRVEKHNNAFALKFYTARDRKNINKYHRIINAHDYKNLVRLLLTCFEVIPDILSKYPTASFVVNGANSRDLRTHTEENFSNNQRFRIYKELTLRKIGNRVFEHFYFEEASSFMLVNRGSADDINLEAQRLKDYLLDIYCM